MIQHKIVTRNLEIKKHIEHFQDILLQSWYNLNNKYKFNCIITWVICKR